ncbi:MAG: VCBS repeat-containing protein [Planctomycetota bacterium]|nr:VCBS repeat-containing protein [Planctomycetota bacterium]
MCLCYCRLCLPILKAFFLPYVLLPAGDGPGGVVTHDFDGNGRADIVVANSNAESISVYLSQPGGGFVGPTDYPTGRLPYDLVVRDFNSDNRADLAISNGETNDISIYNGMGDGSFNSHARYATGPGPRCIVSADFDDDGRLDLATANTVWGSSNGSVSVVYGQSGGGFGLPQDYTIGMEG